MVQKRKETRFFDTGSSNTNVTAQKMKFFIKDFFSKCNQTRSFLRIWSHLLKKSLMENLVFGAVCSRFHARKNHNSQFHAIEITHLHCTRKSHFTISRNKKT